MILLHFKDFSTNNAHKRTCNSVCKRGKAIIVINCTEKAPPVTDSGASLDLSWKSLFLDYLDFFPSCVIRINVPNDSQRLMFGALFGMGVCTFIAICLVQ